MNRVVLGILCCPNCRHDLTLIEKKVADDEVIDGILKCDNCARSYEIINGVPRMIVDLGDRQELAEGWGFEWTKQAEGKLEVDTYYGKTEEQELRFFFRRLGIAPDDLCGKVILDAGCGYGRLTRALGKYKAEVFGIDIAPSVEHSYNHCRSNKNVHIIQADILNLPFKNAAFDYVWSRLAICYLQNPEQAVRGLSELVKPSGKLFISVPNKANLALVVKLRDFLGKSHRIPRSLLFYLSWCLAPLTFLVGMALQKRRASLRTNAFLLFNALHPTFMTRHTDEEVIGWFEKASFDDITCGDFARTVCVRGSKK